MKDAERNWENMLLETLTWSTVSITFLPPTTWLAAVCALPPTSHNNVCLSLIVIISSAHLAVCGHLIVFQLLLLPDSCCRTTYHTLAVFECSFLGKKTTQNIQISCLNSIKTHFIQTMMENNGLKFLTWEEKHVTSAAHGKEHFYVEM